MSTSEFLRRVTCITWLTLCVIVPLLLASCSVLRTAKRAVGISDAPMASPTANEYDAYIQASKDKLMRDMLGIGSGVAE